MEGSSVCSSQMDEFPVFPNLLLRACQTRGLHRHSFLESAICTRDLVSWWGRSYLGIELSSTVTMASFVV